MFFSFNVTFDYVGATMLPHWDFCLEAPNEQNPFKGSLASSLSVSAGRVTLTTPRLLLPFQGLQVPPLWYHLVQGPHARMGSSPYRSPNPEIRGFGQSLEASETESIVFLDRSQEEYLPCDISFVGSFS